MLSMTVWTPDAIRALGATTDVATAAKILRIGRTKAYALAKAEEFPCRIIRVGRRYLVTVQSILTLVAPDQSGSSQSSQQHQQLLGS